MARKQTARAAAKRPVRWHIAVFLAPAVLIYTAIMILPLLGTLQLSLYSEADRGQVFVGLENFRTLFGDPRGFVGVPICLGHPVRSLPRCAL